MAEVHDRPRSYVGVVTIDDQEIFLRAAREVIDATPGFRLLGEAGSGEAAVAVANAVDPDLVLVDARMPGMDGFATTRHIRAACPGAVIVLISTEDLADARRASSGANAFLPKKAFCPDALRALWVEHGRPLKADA